MFNLLATSAFALSLVTGSAVIAQTAMSSGTMPADPAAPQVPADSPAASALPPTTPTTVSNALPPPPAAELNKSYPVCSRTVQDSCQNPGEGGAPGRSRASNTRHHRHHR